MKGETEARERSCLSIVLAALAPPPLCFSLCRLTHASSSNPLLLLSGQTTICLAHGTPESNNQNDYVSANIARRNRAKQEVTTSLAYYDTPESEDSQNSYVSANVARRNRAKQEVTGKIGQSNPHQVNMEMEQQQPQEQ